MKRLLGISLVFAFALCAFGVVSANADEEAIKWKTTGFKQANSMGGGEAEISKSGKFRVSTIFFLATSNFYCFTFITFDASHPL